MSAVLVLDNRPLCFWQGELPKEGEIIWFERTNKLLRVTTVVHVVDTSTRTTMGKSDLQITVPTAMRRIFVENIETVGEGKELKEVLLALKIRGV